MDAIFSDCPERELPDAQLAMKHFDVCVIGAGGVVGSAVVRSLAERGLSVIGLEKHDGPARETSGLNSRVIHSGFHETPGTLKSQLALAGSRMMAEYTTKANIATLKTGMLIAVPRGAIQHGLWREAGALWHLWRNGRSHGVTFQWIVSSGGIRKIAPIDALGGIFIPSVFVVDVLQLISSLQQNALKRNAEIHYSAAVENISKQSDHYVVCSSAKELTARALVNSAGLAATTISEMAGGPRYSVQLLRGEYYELQGGIARWGIRTLVYPANACAIAIEGSPFWTANRWTAVHWAECVGRRESSGTEALVSRCGSQIPAANNR